MADQPSNKNRNEQNPTVELPAAGPSRRQFISTLGAAAAAGALFGSKRGTAQPRQAEGALYFTDSWGKQAPINPEAISAGVLLPSHTAGGSGLASEEAVADACPYLQPNILLIMVDQLRAPRWLAQSAEDNANSGLTYPLLSSVEAITPNITAIRNVSTIFTNYYVAASKCSPSRATLLTGLYTQQTCLFKTVSHRYPTLQPWKQDGN